MKKSKGSLVVRIISNPDIQKGFVLFALALILAFSAVITTVEDDTDKDSIEPDDQGLVKDIRYPHLRNVENSTLELRGEEETNLSLRILNTNFQPISLPGTWADETGERINLTIAEDENRSLDLTELDDIPRHFDFNVTEGNLTYVYYVSYATSPYGILSLPAILLTIIGMVYAFKGKGALLGEIKERQIEEEERKIKARRQKKYEKGKDREHFEDVIYEGEKKEGKPSDHVNFMGIPEGSEEDEEDQEA